MPETVVKAEKVRINSKELVPRHIAFIIDGNRRWATEKNLPKVEGHRAGLKTLRKTVDYAFEKGVKELSFYIFSTENWRRPKAEVDYLMDLFRQVFNKYAKELAKKQIKVRIPGVKSNVPKDIKADIEKIEKTTSKNRAGTVNFCFNYGGRADILEAAKNLLKKGIKPAQINEATFSDALATAGMQDVDLLVRTSESRLSGFLPWQSVYAELYFLPNLLWPDFDESEFDKALNFFASRKRNFGA